MTDNNIASADPDLPVPGNPIRWHIFGGVLLIAVIAVGTAIMVGNFRERALDRIERELENSTMLLAHHFDQQLEEFEVIQKGLVAYIGPAGIASSEAFKLEMSGAKMHEMLVAKNSGSSDVAGVNIFDADGVLVNSSETWPNSAASVADRAYFKAMKSGSASTPVVIELVVSRLTGVRTMIIARRMAGPNDEFLGIVTRGIATVKVEEFFARLALGDDAVLSMFHRDGTLLARYPGVEGMVGRNFSKGPFFSQVLSKADHGTLHLISPVDGQDRLGSARALSEFPLVVIATTTMSAALADWRDQTRLLITVAGLLMLVVVVMLVLIIRHMSRKHELSSRKLEVSRQRLALEKQRLNTAVNNMSQGLLLFDASGRLIVCNQRYIELFRMSPDVAKPGCSFRDLIAHRKQNGSFNGDIDDYCSNVLRNVELGEITCTILEDPEGRSIQIVNQPLASGGWVATMEDVSERRRAEDRITHLAHYDALTDLPNRVLFRELLERELLRVGPDAQLAVLYLDIDEFKNVNDSLGHLIGDELLKAVTVSLSGCLEKADFIARLGGDEFAIVQTGVRSVTEVTELVARIYQAIRQPYECLGHLVTTDASIGIALAPRDGVDLDQLLKNADLALYRAKADGRRTYRFFEPDMEARVRARRTLEADLRQAMIDGGLEVYYQPVVGLQSNAIVGCEALLRWRHRERGMISPVEFIAVAEETGLINQLGGWALATACAEAATWPNGIKLAVNVSPVQFRSDTLVLKVVAALAASGLAPGRLELEITEAVLIRDDEAALAILKQLRALGVRIALDDFGTGYSSLSYLQRFPFDKIKIDRCFIQDIAEARGSLRIVQAVVSIAAERDMTTTAEGVETEQQRDMLRALGCDEMQGYLFSAAIAAADIRQLLAPIRDSAVA